jgi:putative cardiolipin synthase
MKTVLARVRTVASTSAAMGWPFIVAAALVVGCAAIRDDTPRPPSYAIDDPQETELGGRFAAQLSSTPGMSGFRLLTSGQEAFLARAALAEAAQRTLDLQYYAVAEDATSTLLLYRALVAAQRGVRVRLLIDDLDVGDRDSHLATLAAHPNVQLRVFNPFSWRGAASLARALDYLTDATRLNRRMHNKLWIADNAAALIGGRNLSDAYFNADSLNNFVDLDVLLAGPAVAEASRGFDEYWNSEWAVPIQAFTGPTLGPEHSERLMAELAARAAAFHDSDYVRELLATGFGPLVRSGRVELIAANATVLHDPPAKRPAQAPDEESPVLARLRQSVNATRDELVLVSPYFVPNERGIETLCSLARRGVAVRVLTNSLASTDVAAVHAGYARYRPRLLACSVALHELEPDASRPRGVPRLLSSGVSLHAKAIMVDRKSILIGSMNLDPRSRQTNTEVAVLIDSAALGGELGQWFDEARSLDRSFRPELATPGNPNAPLTWIGREEGKLRRYDSEPRASWWQRVTTRLLGALLPEELL